MVGPYELTDTSQGLDLPDVLLIIQWRSTCDMCTLWQRIGRAARALHGSKVIQGTKRSTGHPTSIDVGIVAVVGTSTACKELSCIVLRKKRYDGDGTYRSDLGSSKAFKDRELGGSRLLLEGLQVVPVGSRKLGKRGRGEILHS
ncbi:hypothetical protein B0H11DRAFT_2040911 [Mycena galericulata]|nr:hypothetical protein B0H11DRAFT_2040911 [Mycena galericulata]